jgi:hypothetical protein
VAWKDGSGGGVGRGVVKGVTWKENTLKGDVVGGGHDVRGSVRGRVYDVWHKWQWNQMCTARGYRR